MQLSPDRKEGMHLLDQNQSGFGLRFGDSE